jgi:hypothetical protein
VYAGENLCLLADDLCVLLEGLGVLLQEGTLSYPLLFCLFEALLQGLALRQPLL